MEQHSDSTVNMASSHTPNPDMGVAVAPVTQGVTSEQRYDDSASNHPVTVHQLPIPPASEPMQYRAIGLIKGTYVPSEEQFTRGMLTTEDDQPVDAVLLGRVMSLVKKHVDLDIPHLWVVYPRTRPKAEHLHAQIVGIWEPDNLNREASDDQIPDDQIPDDQLSDNQPSEVENDAADGVASAEDTEDAIEVASEPSQAEEKSDDASNSASLDNQTSVTESSEEDADASTLSSEKVATTPEAEDASLKRPQLINKPARPQPPVKAEPEKVVTTSPVSAPGADSSSVPNMTDGYFSIRGEVIQFSPDDEQITVRIKQAKRKTAKADGKKGEDESKEFKLQLKGRLEGRVVGYFWDLHAQRNGNDLIVTDSNMIKIVPPQKNRRKKPGGRGGGGRGGPRRRDGGGSRPMRSGDRPTPAGPTRRSSSSKPVLKKSAAKDGDAVAPDA